MALTKDEVAAVTAYSGADYNMINAVLRFAEKADEDIQSKIKNLDSAIAKSKTPKKLVLYRGVDGDYARVIERRHLEVDDSLIDAGFLSTSTREDVAKRFLGWEGGGMLLKINVFAGRNVLDMHPYSVNRDEHEFLLPRDAELRVIGYDANVDALELEVV